MELPVQRVQLSGAVACQFCMCHGSGRDALHFRGTRRVAIQADATWMPAKAKKVNHTTGPEGEAWKLVGAGAAD